DPATGARSELLRETDAAWLNLDQDVPAWLPGGDGFLWTSERSGEWQLEVRNADGSLRRTVTPEGFHYGGLQHVASDGKTAWVLGADNALDRHVYRIALDGSGQPEPLTSGPGRHAVEVASDGSLAVITADIGDGAERWTVRGADGSTRGELVSKAEHPTFPLHTEYVTVDGVAEDDPELPFHALILRPADFEDGRRYPVILHVYGGPHNQMVVRDGSRFLLDQWIADQGYVVVVADGRGTLNRGRAWERAIKHDFISLPLGDQSTILQQLGKRYDELDLDRVGVYGWSFGGYFSAMAVMRRPDLFQAGVAGAPVTDWQDYDTHYTERYIGHPDEQPEAYRRSNVTTYAADLERPLLIVHGTADDNVYFVHGLKMSHALFAAGKAHDFLPLSGQTHMVAAPLFVEQWHQRMMEHFAEHLQPTAD
ncbi:MAG: prolyl oligopeptidase family serine peptidase, partial [Acidobacteriota bacterium]